MMWVADSSRGQLLAERQRTAGPGRVKASAFQRVARESGAVLLSYWLGPEQSWLWVISGSGVQLLPLPQRSEIEKLKAETWLKAVRVPIERLGSPILELSGGNQQKVLMARALMTDSEVILLDDPNEDQLSDQRVYQEVHRTILHAMCSLIEHQVRSDAERSQS